MKGFFYYTFGTDDHVECVKFFNCKFVKTVGEEEPYRVRCNTDFVISKELFEKLKANGCIIENSNEE